MGGSQRRQSDESKSTGPEIAVYAILASFWVFCSASSFLPQARLWGINHLAFYPWPVRLAGIAVMAVSLLPAVRREVLRWLTLLSAGLSARRWLTAAALSLVAFVLFIAFASSTQLLGDGLYVENNVERAAKVDAQTLLEVLKNPDPNYAGTEMLYLSITRSAAGALGVPPVAVLRVLIAFFGALLLFILCASYRPSSPAPAMDLLPFVVIGSLSGAAQIYFGYVETYAPVLFFSALFALSAARTITRGASLWGPILCALAAAGMHLLGLILLPALGVLILWAACRRRVGRAFVVGALGIAAATVAVPPIVVVAGGLGRFVLPVVDEPHVFTVFSAEHLTDVLNEILLVAPVFLVLVGVAIVAARGKMRSWWTEDRNGAPGRRGEDQGSVFVPALVFALALGLAALLFLFFFKPELGMARDWDLFAVTVFGLSMPLFVILARARMDSAVRGVVDIAVPSVLVMAAVLSGAWVGVNANGGRSVARFESVLSYDRTNAAYAYETLASYFHGREDFPAEIGALERAVESSRNPRYLFTLGLRYYYVGEKEKAVRALETCLRVKPDHAQARQSLVQMLFFMDRNQDLFEVCEDGARLAPDEPYYPLFEGMAYVRLGRIPDARAAFDRCLSLNPSPEVVGEIENILRSLPPDSGGGGRGDGQEYERKDGAR